MFVGVIFLVMLNWSNDYSSPTLHFSVELSNSSPKSSPKLPEHCQYTTQLRTTAQTLVKIYNTPPSQTGPDPVKKCGKTGQIESFKLI